MSESESRGVETPTAVAAGQLPDWPGPIAPGASDPAGTGVLLRGINSTIIPQGRLGSYELIRPLAHGGMADVYLGRRVGPGGFERLVALKVLSPSRATDPQSAAMFLDEARLVAMLNHQNIASVLEVDVVDGHHFLAMEYVHGADLREIAAAAQRQHVSLPLETALSIVCAAGAGLDHAHRRCAPDGTPLELVHRDVSLSNIMVGHDGSVKVVDFGIATTTIASVQTLPGMVRGKASYMSPEQCLGDQVDHRADVFALGVVLYELTTGARCFHGKSDFERMLAVVRSDYIPPTDLVADYPADLAEVIRIALASDPDLRFASAAALITALEHVAINHGWIGGPSAIQRLMQQLFGSAASGSMWQLDDAPVTEPCSLVALPLLPTPAALTPPTRPAGSSPSLCEPTRPAHRLCHGTESDCVDEPRSAGRGSTPEWGCGEIDDDLDERTRGRRPLRRPCVRLAA